MNQYRVKSGFHVRNGIMYRTGSVFEDKSATLAQDAGANLFELLAPSATAATPAPPQSATAATPATPPSATPPPATAVSDLSAVVRKSVRK